MKIVHLISGGDVGGAKTHIETLLPKLNSMNVETQLLCVMEGALTEECRRLSVSVKVIPQGKRYDLTVVKKMADWLNSEGFDIIHCHGARANFIAFFLRFFVKAPMLTTLHSDYMLDFKGSGYRHYIYTPLNIFSLKRFKHFIAVSEIFRKMMTARGFDCSRIDVIHNGVNFDGDEGSRSESLKQAFLSENGVTVDENTVIIGCVARLQHVKGVDILLNAAKLLFENNVNAVILIAGDGSEMTNLAGFIEKNSLMEKVRLLGFIKDITSFYAAIDINVLSSRSEGIPLTLLEGARFGLSTIASRTGGVPEVITDGETGLLFEVGDYKTLSGILLNEINNPKEGKKRGEALRDDAKKRFSLEKMAARHIEVYNKVLLSEGRKVK